jgi:hypothetical protein
LSRNRDSIPGLQKGKYPLLESLSEYQEAVRLEKEIDNLLNQYRKIIGNVLERIREWTWNDPVSKLYAELFREAIIFDPPIDKEKVQTELLKRQLHRIPPGYKDSSKEDLGVGDLLIWFTILEIGQSKKKDVIFVSSDQKTDWWHRSEKQPLYPRFELVDEFRRCSGGCSFHIIPFSHFLDLYGANESIVKEVREEERKLGAEISLIGEFILKWQTLEQMLLTKYRTKNPDAPVRWISVSQILSNFYQNQLVSTDFVDSLQTLNRFRNAMVHGETSFSTSEIKEKIARLDEILDEVRLLLGEDITRKFN